MALCTITSCADSFQTAITCLSVAETGELWTALMRDTMHAKGWYVSFYWIVFVLIKVYILLNVVIAVIFEKLEAAAQQKRLGGDIDHYL